MKLRNQIVTKSIVLAICAMAAASLSLADNGGHSGNGGGSEILFQSITTQNIEWLEAHLADGTLTAKLHLNESGVLPAVLVDDYKNAVKTTPDIQFIPSKDLSAACKNADVGACMLSNEPSRICFNHSNPNFIRCNEDRFNEASGDVQFSINFHEYLGVANQEVNGNAGVESYSQYPISRYLMMYASPRTVVRYELGDAPACGPHHDGSFLIKMPTLGDNVLLSGTSDQNGVCVSLGYQRAAVGSAVLDCSISADTSQAIVNDRGDIVTGDLGKDICRISQLICLNMDDGTPKIKTTLLKEPRHSQSQAPYSGNSDQNGVCVSSGYERAAVGSELMDCTAINNLSQVIVDASGAVTGGDLGANICRVSQLVCISKP